MIWPLFLLSSDLLGWATLEEYHLKARFQALHRLSPSRYADPDAPSADFKVCSQLRGRGPSSAPFTPCG